MKEAVKAYIAVQELIKPGDKVIVAVSGGPDSMALLHILWELSREMEFSVAAAHLNHQLRPQAVREQEFVEEYCQHWQIACYSRTVDVRQMARQQKASLEDAGRQARYTFFRDLSVQLKADRIATAHHQDDQAETVLLHLLRGTGLQGLRGIMPCNDQLIRPLLGQSKQAILAYLKERNISYCLDQSNQDQSFLRNRIRLQLIPFLQEGYNPQITENLSRLAEIVRAENELLQQIVQDYWTQLICRADEHNIAMDLAGFKALPLAVQRRLALKALAFVGGSGGWEAGDVEKILDLLQKPGSAKILRLKKGIMVNKSYDKIIFASNWQKAEEFVLEVAIPGRAVLPDGRCYAFSLIDNVEVINRPRAAEGTFYLDYDKLCLPLLLRSRLPGDVIQPVGLAGHKKLKKYLNEQRIPHFERERVAILAAANGAIYALPEMCVCTPAALDGKSQHLLQVKRVTVENNGDNL